MVKQMTTATALCSGPGTGGTRDHSEKLETQLFANSDLFYDPKRVRIGLGGDPIKDML
jgi:hypothetical protein